MSPLRTARRLPGRPSRRRLTARPCPRPFRPFSGPLALTTSPQAAPSRVACGPWAATCAADSAGHCITVLGGPSSSSLPTTTWIWSGSARATAYPMTRMPPLAEAQRLNAVAEGPGVALASFFEVEILPPVSPSEAGPHSATPASEAASSAAGGNNAEGAAPPPADV
jgi:hypothetical protein